MLNESRLDTVMRINRREFVLPVTAASLLAAPGADAAARRRRRRWRGRASRS